MQVKIATTDQERAQVFALRYEVYVEELGRSMRHADHERRSLPEPLDESGHLLCCYDGVELTGGLRMNFADEAPLGEYEELYGLSRLGAGWQSRTSVTSRLVVRRDHRGSALAMRLAREACRLHLERGLRYDVIDCHPRLLELYRTLGYRPLGDPIEHPDNGLAHCLVFDVTDHAHHERVRSPLRRICLSARRHRAA